MDTEENPPNFQSKRKMQCSLNLGINQEKNELERK